MAKARKILRRQRAVGSIRDVTNTMEMVATARFKQAHDLVIASRPYTDRLGEMVGALTTRLGGKDSKKLRHPLMFPRTDTKKDVLMVLTTDRGLCGGHSQAILRTAMARLGELIQAGRGVELHVVGRRGSRYLQFRGFHVDHEYTDVGDLPHFEPIGALADRIRDAFLAGEIGAFEITYMQFISSGRQEPGTVKILPLSGLSPPQQEAASGNLAPEPLPYDFFPSAEELLSELLPYAVRLRTYQCFLDAACSEHVARMGAMRAATDNADEMLRDLRVTYNRLRQSQITTELAEIMGGREGVQ